LSISIIIFWMTTTKEERWFLLDRSGLDIVATVLVGRKEDVGLFNARHKCWIKFRLVTNTIGE
jgi:hypothetical protein